MFNTGLSKYMWQLADRGIRGEVSYNIITTAVPRQKGDRRCDICVSEKTYIARSDPSTSMNRRDEVMNKCRHKAPLMLSNFLGMVPPEEGESSTQRSGNL